MPWSGPHPTQPRLPGSHSKNPIAAAVLNLFLPGTGYVYTGIGRDMGEVVFGALVFAFFFIGFEVTFVAEALTLPPSVSSGPVSPYAALLFLVFLLPLAFAYDGYHRAKFG